MEIDITTESINEDGKDIAILLGEIKEILDDTFDTLDKNNAWAGISADRFHKDLLTDKQNYIHFREMLNKYSGYLTDYSLEMDKLIGALRK